MQIDSFLKYIRYELNYSVHTVLSYSKDLSQFVEFLSADKETFDAASVTVSDVRAWVYSLNSSGFSVRSVRRKVQSLRAFYKFLLKRGVVADSPVVDIPMAKLPQVLPVFVREKGMDQVLDSPFDETDFTEVRNRLMVAMFYETGIRRAELISLKNSDVNTDSGELKVHGKRNKDRIVPFGKELGGLIELYRKLRSEVAEGSTDELFVTAAGRRVYPSLVYNVVTGVLSEVTQAKRSPHVLRHSFASAMLNNGAELNSVKELLGHGSLAATQVYTHITYSELKNNYKHAHPRALKKEGNMEVKIKAIHFDATTKLEEFINKKAQKLARRNEAIATFEVTLKVVKPETSMNKEAAIKLTVPNADELFASKVADTFEEAVDLTIDALDRQLVKLKEKK